MSGRSMLCALLFCVAFPALPLAAQEIRGRVVDERSRQAVRDAAVSLLDTEGGVLAEATTDGNGFFTVRAPAAGTYTVVVIQPGYAEQRREVSAKAGETLIPAFVLTAEAVPLDPLEVEARGSERGGPPPAGFQRSSHIIAGANLARLERQGGTLMTAVKEMGGLRTREYKSRNGVDMTCVESSRVAATGLQIGGTMMDGNPAAETPCQWVAIVVDGVLLMGDPMRNFREVKYLGDYESVEYLPPAEAGRLYGMDASTAGALVLWTRGRGPHVSENRNR